MKFVGHIHAQVQHVSFKMTKEEENQFFLHK